MKKKTIRKMSNVYKYLKENRNILKIIPSKGNSNINIWVRFPIPIYSCSFLSSVQQKNTNQSILSAPNVMIDRKKHTHTRTQTHICKINMTIYIHHYTH